ncbi:MAG: F0F1 ATP synthase subunit beta, partial [Thermodesulfobacteriota bacterium]|nr:F0F1 ATP synthase subunit beta [Thermodesulfobacteriota bacterium]
MGNSENQNVHYGQIAAVRGNVVDVRFSPPLPPRNNQLRTGPENHTVLEVQTHLDTTMVRCIALNTTRRLGRGMPVQDTDAMLQVPVGEALLGRMLNVFGEPVDGADPLEIQ